MAGDNLARVRANETELQRPKAPQIKHKKNPHPKANILAKCVKSITISVFAFALGMLMLYGKVEMSRLSNEQAKLEQQLAQLREDNLGLESQLESQTSYDKVEDYAENVLGLKKLDKTQIEYIELENDKVIQVIEPEEEGFFESVKEWVGDVLEYIGI